MNREQRQKQKRKQKDEEKKKRREEQREKDQAILSAIKSFFLFFGILFLSMLLAYIGTNCPVPFFLLSVKHTSLPLVLPLGLCVGTYFFRKSYRLIAPFAHWIVKLWFWVGICVLVIASVSLSVVYLYEWLTNGGAG